MILMRHKETVTPECSLLVRKFLERDDNSRCQPGKKDAMKSKGCRERQQTRIMTDYMQNLYLKFKSEHPDRQISFSTFCRAHPKNVLYTSFISRNSCLCTKHTNMALEVECMRKSEANLNGNPDDLLKKSDEEIDITMRNMGADGNGQVMYKNG